MNKFVTPFLLLVAMVVYVPNVLARDFNGIATDLESGEVLYLEQHQYLRQSETKTILRSRYSTPTGEQLAFREVEFFNHKVMRYSLRQNSIGYSERIVRTNEGILVEVNDKEKKVAKSSPQVPIIDAGFDSFIRKNWQTLMSDQALTIPFMSSVKASVIGLRATIDKRRSDKDQKTISLTLNNPFLRALMRPIKVSYATDDYRILSFEGVSNIRNDKRKAYRVKIEYTYPETHASSHHQTQTLEKQTVNN